MFVLYIDVCCENCFRGIKFALGGICLHDSLFIYLFIIITVNFFFFFCHTLKEDSLFGTWPFVSSKVQVLPTAL
jgi:hypothetical protein